MNNVQPNSDLSIAADIALTPRLRLPQVSPAQVVATRRRYIAPVVRLQPLAQDAPLPQTPFPLSEEMVFPIFMPNSEGQLPFPTPRAEFTIALSQPEITYIPRAMVRRREPGVVDALIACGTLLLIGLCVWMLLYYISM